MSTAVRDRASTARAMANLVGTTGLIEVGGFHVPMTIHDVKIAYGNIRLLVSPVNGSGESWVDASRVTGTAKKNVDEATHAIVRKWARRRGLKVGERGRIPATVMEEYKKEVQNA